MNDQRDGFEEYCVFGIGMLYLMGEEGRGNECKDEINDKESQPR